MVDRDSEDASAPGERQALRALEPYIPGKPIEEVQRQYGLQAVIKMASNENPWGTSPLAIQAVQEELARIAQYPEGSCRDLRRALARRLGITEAMVTISNGADNILMMIAQAFVDPGDEVVTADLTFPVYRTATQVMAGVPVEVPLNRFIHDLDAMARAVGPRTKMLVICNPNNPTGTMVGGDEIKGLLERLPPRVLVVLDEVYADFASARDFPDGLGFIREGRPVLSVRSFSKLYGLAGLRIGYALGAPELIRSLDRVREPFPVNRLAQAAALAALEDEAFRRRVVEETQRGKAWLSGALGELGLHCLESHTNFLFVDLGRDAQEIFEALLRRGIIIRPGKTWRTPTCCRITVGTPEENERLVAALRELLS
jgi:histidinol-phosphate aminotransferase